VRPDRCPSLFTFDVDEFGIDVAQGSDSRVFGIRRIIHGLSKPQFEGAVSVPSLVRK